MDTPHSENNDGVAVSSTEVLTGHKNNISKFIFAACCGVFIVSFLYYFYYRSTSVSDDALSPTEQKRADLLTKTWSDLELNSSTENLNTYVLDINAQLDSDSLSSRERKELLLKKAVSLGTNRINLQAPTISSVSEATSILRSLFESPQESIIDSLVSQSTISAYISLLNSTCFLPEVAESYPKEYPTLYKSLIEKGVHLRAALLLTTHAFAYTELRSEYEDDISTVANRAYITALYLYSFGDKYDNSVSDESLKSPALLAKLQSDLQRTSDLHMILWKNIYRGSVDPVLRLAFANDVAKTYGKKYITLSESNEIDAQYDNAFVVINSYSNNEDKISDAISKVMNTLMYFDSLHVRYTKDEIDPEKTSMLVDTFITNAGSSKETKSMVKSYFTVNPSEEDWLRVRAGFMEAAVKYPKLKDFFSTELGIDLPVKKDAV